MKLFNNTIGELEELVLLIVAKLSEEAYGIAIKNEIETRTGRELSISAIHSTLHRLQKKGYLNSWMGGAEQIRGGRRKRYFQLTGSGREALIDLKNLRDDLWKMIPELR